MQRSVLIVDDEAAIRRILRRKLEENGYDVHEAGDGKEATSLLRTRSFDVVITDIIMPEQDGIEVICFMRREFPDTKIIAISAPANQLFLDSARGLGASRTFKKPFKLEDVASAVDGVLAG